jgi:hypothetical protein
MPLRYAPSLVDTRYALTAPADPDAPLAAGGASRRVVA